MLEIAIPYWKTLRLEHLVLDLNGTLTLDGALLPGVAERIAQLQDRLLIHLVSADTFGTAHAVASKLAVHLSPLAENEPSGAQKADYVGKLGAARVVAVGNGANDGAMLYTAALGIAVLGPEGLANEAQQHADIMVGDICTAFDLLLKPLRLIAALRGLAG